MTTFALVTEGITDQVVIEALLSGIYGEQVDEVHYIQPALDETDRNRQENDGGWENVFLHLSRPSALHEIFYANDYLVIQIDTDCCEHGNYDVSLRNSNGENRTTEELVDAVRNKLIKTIGNDFEGYAGKIFFAISVHALECWLLPLYAENKSDKRKMVNCATRLNDILSKKNIDYAKDASTYRALFKGLKKSKAIEDCTAHSESMRIFVDSLPKII